MVEMKQVLSMMQGDKPAFASLPFSDAKKKKSILMYTSLLLFLSLSVPLNLPPLLPYKMMVSLLPGNLVCDVVHTFIEPKKKIKNL